MTRHCNMTLYKQVFHAIICATATTLPLQATTVETYTRPLGISVAQVPDGAVMLANPYLAPAVYEAAVSTVDATGVTLSSASVPDVTSLPHYLEIYSGALAGTTLSITAATANSVTLEHEPTGLATADRVRIRPHFTLASTFAHSALGDDNFAEATLYEGNWGRSAYSYSAEHGWYDVHGGANDVILYPAEGLILDSQNLSAVTFIGEVSSSPIRVPLPTLTSSLLGTLNPAEGASLTALGLVSSLKDGDAFGIYMPSGTGGLVAEEEFFFFPGWGFYDYSLNQRDDYAIQPLRAAVILRGSHPTTLTLPAAFTELAD